MIALCYSCFHHWEIQNHAVLSWDGVCVHIVHLFTCWCPLPDLCMVQLTSAEMPSCVRYLNCDTAGLVFTGFALSWISFIPAEAEWWEVSDPMGAGQSKSSRSTWCTGVYELDRACSPQCCTKVPELVSHRAGLAATGFISFALH